MPRKNKKQGLADGLPVLQLLFDGCIIRPWSNNTMNEVFKALADPSRREILRLLGSGEKSAGDLAEHFDMTKPSMSHHFAVLKDADLIRSRREGTTIYYSLNTTVVEDLMTWALDLTQGSKKRRNAK